MDLSGKCLIARPNMVDPFFAKSVVYIYEYSTRGTAGVIINKKLVNTTRVLLANKGFNTHVPEEPLFAGGPVNERAVVMVHTNDWHSSNTFKVNDSVGVTSDDIMLFRYSQGDTPRHYKFCCGASVWHPKQLSQEIARNSWLIQELDVETLFETDPKHLWDTAVEQAAAETMEKYI